MTIIQQISNVPIPNVGECRKTNTSYTQGGSSGRIQSFLSEVGKVARLKTKLEIFLVEISNYLNEAFGILLVVKKRRR